MDQSMPGFQAVSTHLRFLIVSDIDARSVSKLAEYFVPKSPQFDCCIVSGPFTHFDLLSREDEAKSTGDMASIIAQLENIVCRVVYLPSDKDPISSLVDQLHLTPNSICIHARMLPLSDGLCIAGFTEKDETLNNALNLTDVDGSSDYNDEEVDGFDIKASTSINIMHEILNELAIEISTKTQRNIIPTSIFLLNYKYSHTLNHFLFHSVNQLNDAGVNLCIISSTSTEGSGVIFPETLHGLALANPHSLQLGYYLVIDFKLQQQEQDKFKWIPTLVQNCQLGVSDF